MKNKNEMRYKRHARLRTKISGTQERPRLVIFKSNKYIYAQIIDDTAGTTLLSVSSFDKAVEMETTNRKSIDAANRVGETVARKAIELNITEVVFDRGGYKYHGKIKALADSARGAGLKF